MPRQHFTTVENNFSRGLITQATGLNFPEKACTDTLNCIFNELGAVGRRRGFNFEPKAATKRVDRTVQSASSGYLWKNVAGDSNIVLVVVQVGDELLFYDAVSYANVSSGIAENTIDLNDHNPTGNPQPRNKECQFASGHGVLFVFHPTLNPFYVEFDLETREVSSTEIDIQVRDFEGEVDELDVDERPTMSFAAMSDKHHYNLLNQGWTDTNIQAWDAVRTDLPSNADVMWLFKNSSDVYDPATTVDGVMAGNSPAPRGHFIMNVFNQDRSTIAGLPNLTTTSTGKQRISTGAFFAGRVWYSGIDAQKFKGHLYFSQIIERFDQFGQCHQVNDPTSETLFDLLPSDGGKIDIAESGTIYKLVPVQSSLLVFASNGVWAITGSSGLGFTANDYVIQKIAEIPSISGSSFVIVAGYPMWWNRDGIYVVEPQQGGGLAARSLTDQTIRTFFNDIPDSCKKRARGAYNYLDKTVQWLYRETEAVTFGGEFNFTNMLTLNLQTGAFYPWKTSGGNDYLLSEIFFLDNMATSITETAVLDSDGDAVLDEDGNAVIILTKSGEIASRFVYSVIHNRERLTFSFPRGAFYDWPEEFDYDSYFVTGYKIHGEAQRKFQSNYIYVYAAGHETGEFYIRGIWDASENSDTGKWSTRQHILSNNSNYAFVKKRVKLRGQGHVVQFKVESVPGKSFNLIGWSIFESSNKWV